MATFSNSELQEKEGSDGSILCANNCGFFGCSDTMNLCSVCYKVLMKNQNNAKAEEDGTSSTTDVSMKLLKGNRSMRLRDTATGEEEEGGEGEDASMKLLKGNQCKRSRETATGDEEEGEEGEKSNAKKLKPNRCSCCKKRVGLTGFHCRCGDTFCGLHRYAEEHNCPYDYRKAAQQSIAKDNPVIKAEKFQKF